MQLSCKNDFPFHEYYYFNSISELNENESPLAVEIVFVWGVGDWIS